MLSLSSVLRLARRGRSLTWAPSVCGASPAHSRRFASQDNGQTDALAEAEQPTEQPFDAAAYSAPYSVHQLIGDPRTGIADDTTTAPWGDDLSVEWVWSDPDRNQDWYRYSTPGPVLPYMYMDSRLSDHSKNLLYMLRCKDPERWTIPALADKFRIRRQRVMAILALKEMQAHQLSVGEQLYGALQPYSFKIPLKDFHIQPNGEPVDLAQLVQQQQRQQAGTAAAGALGDGAAATAAVAADDSIGSLEDFLATASSTGSNSDAAAQPEAQQQESQPDAEAQQQPTALSSLTAAAGGQAADLAALMPRITLHTQQLQLQLLQLLQQHHYSIEELQQRLLQQVDQAEAYYNAHIAGTDLEQILAPPAQKAQQAAAEDGDAAATADAAEEPAAPAKPAWLDFDSQREQIKQLMQALGPVLQFAGTAHDREVGRLVAQLKRALQDPAGDSSTQSKLQDLTKSAEQSGHFAAAFNHLDVDKRKQLSELVPEARATLNIQGADLRAAIHHSTPAAGSESLSSTDSRSSSAGLDFEPPGTWPGAAPVVVDVWGYEELPRKQMAALQEGLKPMQQTLRGVSGAVSGNGSNKSKLLVTDADVAAVQRAVQVYSGLVYEYDEVLDQQAAQLVGGEGVPALPPQAQRRLLRILREMDMMAVEKLMLWETLWKEKAQASGTRDSSRLRRLSRRVVESVQQLNEESVKAGQPHPFEDYPDLPDEVKAWERVNIDLATSHLDAEVIGRQFHRGSGDRHFKRIKTYPTFEGYSLEEFDKCQEGEISVITRLAAEREDNMLWKEFRESLLKNIGLLAPDLHDHLAKARPPKPRQGWSFVVHPVGADARKFNRWQLKQRRRDQYLDVERTYSWYEGLEPGQLGSVEGFDPALNPGAPAEPYVAMPGRKFRGLNEEESMVLSYRRAKPRRKVM